MGEAGIGIFHYDVMPESGFGMFPDRVAYCGDIDLTGERRPVSYLREFAYGLREEPYLFAEWPEVYGKKSDKNKWKYKDGLASWTFPGYEGKPVWGFVLTNDDEVELYLNPHPWRTTLWKPSRKAMREGCWP